MTGIQVGESRRAGPVLADGASGSGVGVRSFLAVLLTLWVVVGTRAFAQVEPLTLLSQWPEGPSGIVRSLALMGTNLLAAMDEGGLQVFGTGPATKLEPCGGIVPLSNSREVRVAGPYAFLAQYEQGVVVVDMSDPSHPSQVAACPTPLPASGLVLGSSYAFVDMVWNTNRTIGVVDIRDPRKPVDLGLLDIASPRSIRPLEAFDDVLFCSVGNETLQIVCVQDPHQPEVLSEYTAGLLNGVARICALSPDHRRLYLATHTNGLLALDVSDLRNPRLLGRTSTTGYINAMAVTGDQLVLACDDFKVQVLGVSDPANMSLLGEYWSLGNFCDIQVDGRIAYVTKSDGASTRLEALDISNPSNVLCLASRKTMEEAYKVRVRGTRAYVANGLNGLQVLDVGSPERPMALGQMATQGRAQDVLLAEDVAYVADLNGWLFVADLTDPGVPKEVVRLPLRESCGRLDRTGDYLYAELWGSSRYDGGVQVLDIKERRNPKVVAIHEGWTAVAVRDHFAFHTDTAGNFRVCDMTDPVRPVDLAVLEGLNGAVRVAGDRVYVFWSTFEVCQDVTKIQIVDVSDVRNPERVGLITTYVVCDVAVSGTRLFNAAGPDGLEVWNIASPDAPALLAQYPTGGYSWGVTAADGLVTVADRSRVFFYRSQPEGFREIDVKPVAQGVMAISFQTTAGRNYSIKATQDLVDWAEIGSVPGTGSSTTFMDLEAPRFTSRFYKVRER